ncbi:hypothetical protein SKAU_G00137420 [Synaphobranchus kaupii]|uniref:Uncharacterized protein n=1 Tax=Synaphobranchus kaupii TaxID=118154 RepID=A0A9Q1J3N3_SYNKA|nr:hypothetical protein SKAU_G00137420 [Synaphobranchus kaupii]
MSLLEWLQEPPFQAKEPQDKSRKTGCNSRNAFAKANRSVGCHGMSTEKAARRWFRCKGDKVEVQTCYAEDTTGRIKLQLWGDQIGTFSDGCSYNFTNLSTREFARKLFLTTTRKSTILQMPRYAGYPSFRDSFR